MKRISKALFLILGLFLLSACGNNKYVGYWCNYDETATVVVLLNNGDDASKKIIEDTVVSYQNLETMNFYSKEDYASEINESVDTLDIYDTYVLMFNSMDSIGTYVDELNKLDVVKEASQANAKANISLYNIKKNGKYEYSDSDEIEDKDVVKGKYKIKNGVITFTSEDNKTTMLYIKDDHLCGDSNCNDIYAESNAKCETKSSK